MTARRMLSTWFFSALLGCSALFSKSEPLGVNYYAPPERAGRFAASGEMASQAGQPLRVGRVVSSAHLDVRLVSRHPGNQLVYQNIDRWTESPARYLERGLLHALFEERGLTQAMSGRALTLEAELVAFEGRLLDEPSARVSATFTLHDERTSRIHETVTVERPLANAGNASEALVAALSDALDECIERIVNRVVAELPGSTEGP